jgi:hypothetical protein
MVTFDASDFDAATADSGTVHEATSGTDYGDASRLQQGYAVASPFRASDLAFFYPLHDTSGPISDFSGNGNDLTVNGPTLGQTGILGTPAVSFDNTDDYAQGSVTGLSGSFTICLWANSPRTGERDSILGLDGTGGDVFFLGFDSSDEYFSRDFDSSKNGVVNSLNDTTTSAQDGTWHFLATVFDTSSDEVRDYVDGTLSIAYSAGGHDLTLDDRLALGSRAGQPQGRYYNGRQAFVSGFDAALPQSDIQELYDVVATTSTLTTQFKTV